MSRCPNCSAELADEYCSRCGQQRIRPQDLSARHVAHELLDEIVNVRANFKTLRSLRGLMIPGLLTAEYLNGRRQTHLSPIRLYLVCAAIFFLAAPAAGFSLASMLDADPSGALRQRVSTRLAERDLEPALFNARFDVRIQSVYTLSLGAGTLLVAVTLQLLFRRKAMPYGAHLIFALHYISFMYLVTVVAGASRSVGVPTEAAVLSAYGVIAPYLIVALRRVYEETWGRMLWKGGVLLILTLAVNNLASLAAIRLTLAIV